MRETRALSPGSPASASSNLFHWGCAAGFSHYLISAAQKATFLPLRHSSLPTAEMFTTMSFAASFLPMWLLHKRHNLSDDLRRPHLPVNEKEQPIAGAPGSPPSSVPFAGTVFVSCLVSCTAHCSSWLQPKVLFWLFTRLVGSPLTLSACIWSRPQIPNCVLQAEFPPDLHATTIKICCLIQDLCNEPGIFYRMLDFWLTWYAVTQRDTHAHPHTHQSRGLKQQQLFSWHRAGALWFLEQVDYLTSSR